MTDEIRRILNERQKAYGDFQHNAIIARQLKLYIPNNIDPVAGQALCVIMDKIARLLSGDAFHRDTWLDIQGYAQLVIDHVEQNRNEEDSLS